MSHFINKQHTSTIEDYMNSYVAKKSADCILYSEDGSQFKIHKELIGQTEFMRQILTSAKGQCCSMIEIICLYKKEDLQNLWFSTEYVFAVSIKDTKGTLWPNRIHAPNIDKNKWTMLFHD